MHQKGIYNLVLSLFFAILFAVPIFWVIRGPVKSLPSNIEGRDLEIFPAISFSDLRTVGALLFRLQPAAASEQFFNEFLKVAQIEKASADQFPFRFSAIQLAKGFDRGVINTAYACLPDPAIPADMKSGLYVTRDGSRLLFVPELYTSGTEKTIKKRVSNYNTLISDHPELNFYLFYHQRLNDSPYSPLNQYFKNADEGSALAYFEANLPNGLTFQKMLITSYENSVDEYYATDHHWNIRGIGRAYELVYDMVSKNYPEMGPRINVNDIITFPGISFQGSWARQSFYPVPGEPFQVIKLDIPDYQVFYKGRVIPFNSRKAYLAGIYPTEAYAGHYENYYGSQRSLLDFEFDNEATRNILIFGSSYARPLVPMIGSNYHHAYYVDLRRFRDFSLQKFLDEYQVTDVLIIGDNPVAFSDMEWKINP